MLENYFLFSQFVNLKFITYSNLSFIRKIHYFLLEFIIKKIKYFIIINLNLCFYEPSMKNFQHQKLVQFTNLVYLVKNPNFLLQFQKIFKLKM